MNISITDEKIIMLLMRLLFSWWLEIDRSTSAIKEWLPLSAAAAAISFVIAFVMHVPPEQTIVASIMGGILVFSGLLFRSFGKEDDKYRTSK